MLPKAVLACLKTDILIQHRHKAEMLSKVQTLIRQCHKSLMLQLILLSRCVPCTSDDSTVSISHMLALDNTKWYCTYQASRAASYCWGTGEACCWGTTAAALLGSTTVGGGWASAIDASRMRFCCSFFWYLWPERRWAAATCCLTANIIPYKPTLHRLAAFLRSYSPIWL